MLIEFKEAAYSKAFELLDEAKEHSKETKMVLCALEDALYECYDASKEESDSYDSEEDYGDFEGSEVNYRRGRRSAMRYRNNGEYDHRMNSRSAMRMRRGSSRQY